MPRSGAQLYDYQVESFDKIITHKRYVLIKSRKIGATELVLRTLIYQGIHGDSKGYQILVVPGTRTDLANRHIRYMRTLLEHGGYADMIDYEKTRAGDMYLKDGTEFIGLPSNSNSLRGLQNVNLIFMDEAAFFDQADQDAILSAVEPSLSITDGWLCMVSTPNGKQGMFYNVVSSNNEWHKHYVPYTRTLNKLIKQEYIERVKRDGIIDFEQEYNCQFSTPQNAVYPKRLLEFATGDIMMIEVDNGDFRINPTPKFTTCYAGLDIARIKDFTSLVILGKVEQRWKPLVVKIYPHISWDLILLDLKTLYKEFRVQNIAADKTSLGQGFIDFVVAENMNVDGIQFTSQSKTDMINQNKKLFQTQELQLPKGEPKEILLQFEEQMKTDTGGGVRYSHPEGRHDDAFWAWHLAAFLIGQKSEQYVGLL